MPASVMPPVRPDARPRARAAALLAGLLIGACGRLAPRVAVAAESTTEWEGAPAITHVKMLRNDHLLEWWAWVTIEHEDWPIETRLFPLPDALMHPLVGEGETMHERTPADDDKVTTRLRRLTHPYRHFVNWWVIVGPKNEKIHKRNVEQPHPGGWPFTLLERGIKIPLGITQVTFKAHDKIHGYGPRTVTVDILKKSGPGFEVDDVPPPPYTGRRGVARRHFRVPDLSREIRNTNW
jgi:hypothetical protein